VVKDRLRPADPAWVEALAAMIDENGLQQPIVLRLEGGKPRLVAGLHRLLALRQLGIETLIEGQHFTVVDYPSADHARIGEIDENLGRHDLTALDRALFLAERKAVYERLHPETAHGKAPKSRAAKLKDGEKSQTLRLSLMPKRFTAEAAEKTGFSERAVQLSLDLAAHLSPAAIAHIRGTWLAKNQQKLLELAREERAAQEKIAQAVGNGVGGSVSDIKIALGLAPQVTDDPQPRYLAALFANWDKASKRTRAQFLEHIGAALVPAPKGKPKTVSRRAH
jgi:ParB family chromosome partitioning protein